MSNLTCLGRMASSAASAVCSSDDVMEAKIRSKARFSDVKLEDMAEVGSRVVKRTRKMCGHLMQN